MFKVQGSSVHITSFAIDMYTKACMGLEVKVAIAAIFAHEMNVFGFGMH